MADTGAMKQAIVQAAIEAAKAALLAISREGRRQSITAKQNGGCIRGHETWNRTIPMKTSLQLECKRQVCGMISNARTNFMSD